MEYDAIYKFTSYNSESILGYGTRQEAIEHCEFLESVTNKVYNFEETEIDFMEADKLECIVLNMCFN